MPECQPPTLDSRLKARSPETGSRHVMNQRWESLLFLHWEVSPELIQTTLPPGLYVDTFEGSAFVGVVPFFMKHIRPVGCPPLPWLSYFQELNVRTYVYNEQGIPGVWFYSLDCNQPLAVWAARTWFHLPYLHSKMTYKKSDWVLYHSHRAGTDVTASFEYRGVGVERESDPETLEFFLLERYYLYAYHATRRSLFRGQVAHSPYRYRNAEVRKLSTLPLKYDGFSSLPDAPIHQCMAEGLDVKIMGLEVCF